MKALIVPTCAGLIGALITISCTSADARIANGDEPIPALAVATVSTRYTDAYWVAQAVANTTVWTVAVDYCSREGRDLNAHPNCTAVRKAVSHGP